MFLQLLAQLLPSLALYGPEFLHEIIDLFHGTPQLPDETEANYIVRLNAMAEAHLANAKKNNDAVIADA